MTTVCDEDGEQSSHIDIPFSVASWNCLADCYSRGPSAESDAIVTWKYRSKLIKEILRKHDSDLLCLQEVDRFDNFLLPFLKARDYCVEYTKRHNRQDGVLIAYKRKKFQLVRRSVLRFDDLSRIHPVPSPLSVESLRKQNVALVLCLQPIIKTLVKSKTDQEVIRGRAFVVCTTHLYWNPHHSYVKLAQTHYLLEYLTNFRYNADQLGDLQPSALLLTGDFNSEPESQQYRVIMRGKPVHPVAVNDPARQARDAICNAIRRKGWVNQPNNEQEENKKGQDVGVRRFLCDATLKKLARWLRLLGVDTALEDNESQERRAVHNDYAPLFLRATKERRILVTTSTSMQKRNTCPETFLIRTSSSNAQLKSDLAALLNRYDVKLEKSSMFTICGKCGGEITPTDVNDHRLCGRFIPDDRQIFVCNDCHQPYWFSERSEGCSSRARKLANSLFSYVEAVASLPKQTSNGNERSKIRRTSDACYTPLVEDVTLKWPLPDVDGCRKQWMAFQSAFAQVHGKEPEYTNVNGTYRGTLDYIFVAGALRTKTALVCNHRYDDEDSGEQLMPMGNNEGPGLFPNSNWPSDHFLVGADVVLKTEMSARGWLPRSRSSDTVCG